MKTILSLIGMLSLCAFVALPSGGSWRSVPSGTPVDRARQLLAERDQQRPPYPKESSRAGVGATLRLEP